MIEVSVMHGVDVRGQGTQKEEDSEKKRKKQEKNIVSALDIEITYQGIVCSDSYFPVLTC